MNRLWLLSRSIYLTAKTYEKNWRRRRTRKNCSLKL